MIIHNIVMFHPKLLQKFINMRIGMVIDTTLPSDLSSTTDLTAISTMVKTRKEKSNELIQTRMQSILGNGDYSSESEDEADAVTKEGTSATGVEDFEDSTTTTSGSVNVSECSSLIC